MVIFSVLALVAEQSFRDPFRPDWVQSKISHVVEYMLNVKIEDVPISMPLYQGSSWILEACRRLHDTNQKESRP